MYEKNQLDEKSQEKINGGRSNGDVPTKGLPLRPHSDIRDIDIDYDNMERHTDIKIDVNPFPHLRPVNPKTGRH